MGIAFQALSTGLVNIDKAGWQFKDEGDIEDLFGFALETKPKEEIALPVAMPFVPGQPPALPPPGLPAKPSAIPAARGSALVIQLDAYACSRRVRLTPAERRALARLPAEQACDEVLSIFDAPCRRRFVGGIAA